MLREAADHEPVLEVTQRTVRRDDLRRDRRTALTEIALALAVFTVGVAIYMLDRPAGSAYLLPPAVSLAAGGFLWFGNVGLWLPSFVHVFVFSLLTAALLPATRNAAVASCLAWWAIDSLFEVGQHPAFASSLATVVSPWLDGLPVIGNAPQYFVLGTFDPADLVAAALGALAAFCTRAFCLRRAVR